MMTSRLNAGGRKSGASVARDFFTGLETWLALAGDLGVDPLLVYGGRSSYQQKGVRVVGWRDLDTVGRWLDCG